MKLIKKCMIATFAALMLAGALCSISGATPMRSLAPVAVIGEGSSPLPAVVSTAADNDTAPSGNRF